MNEIDTAGALEGLDIAIIGMSGQFPGAKSIEEFWQNIVNGIESISFFTDEELKSEGIAESVYNDPNYVRARGILEGAELFDASFFGFYPKEVEIMDPQQRLFLEHAWSALENAGYAPESYNGLIGLFGGVGMNTYLLRYLFYTGGNVSSAEGYQLTIGNDKDFLTTRISYKLNLKGPSINVQSACSTSLVATYLACQSLLSYQCDMALAGGATVFLPQKSGYFYQEGMILSPDGHCRAFDAKAKGTVAGNGVATVVLKRLTDAIADRDYIYAVIKGSACNNDGSTRVGYTAPGVDGQSEVIAAAHAAAAISPDTITYIETHGTGTTLGDPIEIEALTRVFRECTDARGYCAIGSVKTNVGHLDTAAGITGLIKTALALKHKLIPPSLHYDRANPGIDFDNSPFYVNTKLVEWHQGATPLRAGLSSFGIGGTNVHMVLEEAPELPGSDSRPYQLLTLSAKSTTALNQARENLAGYYKNRPNLNLADAAYTLTLGRKAFNYRMIAVCDSVADASNVLKTNDPKRIFSSTLTKDAGERQVIFMFTGQGAQYVSMGLDLYRNEPAFRDQVDHCVEILKPLLGLDLKEILYPADTEIESATARLHQTHLTQPALFVIEYALAQLWLSWGIRPVAMIGHSIGEYVAACLAGVFSLEDALALVAARGRLMQEMPGGAMLSLPLEESKVLPLLGENLSLAAVNGTSLCVVSGPLAEIDHLIKEIEEKGIEYRRLITSHAFHSTMMAPILEPFAQEVRKLELNTPQIPFISNVTGTWIKAGEATDPKYWATHLRHTVRFADGIGELLRDFDGVLLEIGPGQTLSTLARRHPANKLGNIILASIRHPGEKHSDVAFLLNTLGKMWLAGVKVDWHGYYANEERCRVPLPTYPFERQRYWLEAKMSAMTPVAGKTELHKQTDIDDWFYLPSWIRSDHPVTLPQAKEIQEETWLLFKDEGELGLQMAKALQDDGKNVISVMPGSGFSSTGSGDYLINPNSLADYFSLMEILDSTHNIPAVIVHLWSVSPGGDDRSFDDVQARGFYSLLYLARAIGKQNITTPIRFNVLSTGLHEVTGAEKLLPDKATLIGACNVIPQEYRNITCCSLDIAVSDLDKGTDRLVQRLLSEFSANRADVTVAYRGKHRWSQRFIPTRINIAEERPIQLRQEGVYLITGGLGRIGLTFAEYLAQKVQARLALIEMNSFPDRTEWETWLTNHDGQDSTSQKINKLLTIEHLGGTVLVLKADVADLQQLKWAIDRVYQEYGRLNGVIHAAGLVGENSFRTVPETNQDECELQFRAKIHGTKALEQALHGKNYDFCLLQSSLAAILGGLGFVAYSAANNFLDAFARRQNQVNSNTWISVNWDGWNFDDGKIQSAGVGATMAGLAISPEEGVEVFARVLSGTGIAHVIVSTGDLQSRIDKWIKPGLKDDTGEKDLKDETPISLYSRPNLPTTYVAPTTELEQRIVTIWQRLLGIEPIGIHDNFFDLGGNSLLGTQLVSQLRDTFRVELPLRALFEEPTVAGVAKIIEPTKAETDKDLDKIAELLATMEQMSDDEAKALLDRKQQHEKSS